MDDTPKKATKKVAPKRVDELAEQAKDLILHVDKMFDDLFSPRNGMKSEIGSWEFSRSRSMGRGNQDLAKVVTVVRERVDRLAKRIREQP